MSTTLTEDEKVNGAVWEKDEPEFGKGNNSDALFLSIVLNAGLLGIL